MIAHRAAAALAVLLAIGMSAAIIAYIVGVLLGDVIR